jgi:type IV secretory pathway VirD2 relaxase
VTAPYDDLAERLDAIAADLAERAIGVLRAAVERGDDRRPDEERRLTQARRAVEKAAHLLRGLGDVDGPRDERP